MKASLGFGTWPLSSDCEAEGNVSLIYREDDKPVAAIALEAFEPTDNYARIIRAETVDTYRRKGIMTYLFDFLESHGLKVYVKLFNNRTYDNSFLSFLEARANDYSDSKISHVIKTNSDGFRTYCFVTSDREAEDPWHSLFRSIR